MQAQLTPIKALELLKEGNRRFVNNLKINRNLLQQVNETAEGQFPFAFILKIIVVLGHTKCGAIKGACDDVKLGNLSTLLNKVRPAITAEATIREDRNSNNTAFVESVARLNVHHTLRQIPEQSPILAEMVQHGEVALVGGMYNVETGLVEFFEADMVGGNLVSKENKVNASA